MTDAAPGELWRHEQSDCVPTALEWTPDGALVLAYVQRENELFSVDHYAAELRLDRHGAVLSDGRGGGGWSSGLTLGNNDDREEWGGDHSPRFKAYTWDRTLKITGRGAEMGHWVLPMVPGACGGRWSWSPKQDALAVLSFVPRWVGKGRYARKTYAAVYEVWRLDDKEPRAQRWSGAEDGAAAKPVWVGRRALAASGDQLAIFDADTPNAEPVLVAVPTSQAAPRPIGNRDPDRVVVAAGVTLSTVDVRSGAARRWRRRILKPVRQHFSPDMRRVLVERDTQLRLDDLERRKCGSNVTIPKGEHPYLVQQITWFPDGGLVAAVRAVVRLWDARTGEALPDIPRRASGVTWLPDGHLLVYGDQFIEAWEPLAQTLRWSMPLDEQEQLAALWADGGLLAIADFNEYAGRTTLRCLWRPEIGDDSALCRAAAGISKRALAKAARAEPPDTFVPASGDIQLTTKGWSVAAQPADESTTNTLYPFVETLANPLFLESLPRADREQISAVTRRIVARALRLDGQAPNGA